MIETLLTIHVLLLLLLFRLLGQKVGRIIALLYLTYMGVFTVLKPVLLYYYGFFFPYSTNDGGAVQSLLIGSLIFLTIQYCVTSALADRKAPKMSLRVFDFDRASNRGIFCTFAVLSLVSYIGCVLKFGSATYMFSLLDAFEATTNLANGSWYLNYIADTLFIGGLMVMAYSYWRYSIMRSLGAVLLTLAITYFWVKMASRTPALVVIVAWMSCFFTIKRQTKINVIYIALAGYVLLVFLYVGNQLRAGSTNVNWDTAIFGAVVAAGSDLAPVDNAVLLYADMEKYPSTKFVFLLGAALPTVLIPSSIFPLKIPADKDAELTRTFFPGGADTAFYHEDSTLTFTIPASAYADAGFFGVIVASTLYALLMCFYIWLFRQGSRSAKFIGAYLLIVHTVGYRLSIETLLISFYTSVFFFSIIRGLALSFGRKRFSSRGRNLLPNSLMTAAKGSV